MKEWTNARTKEKTNEGITWKCTISRMKERIKIRNEQINYILLNPYTYIQ